MVLFADNPWSLGICGGFSSPVADELIGESDFILGFGVSFTQWTTKKGKLIAPGASVAQIDIEAPKLGYQRPVQHAVLGDAKSTAEALLTELGRPGRRVTNPAAAMTARASASVQAITITVRIRMSRARCTLTLAP